MSDNTDQAPPAALGMDHGELLDVLHRTMEAAGMDPGADVRDLPARVGYLRGLAEAQPPRREPWTQVPERPPYAEPSHPGPPTTPGWPQPPSYT